MKVALSLNLLALAAASLVKDFNLTHCNGLFSPAEGVNCINKTKSLLNYYDNIGYAATLFLGEKQDVASLGVSLSLSTNLWIGSASVCVTDAIPTALPTVGKACGPLGIRSDATKTPALNHVGWRIANKNAPDADPYHGVKSTNGVALNMAAVYPSGFPFALDWNKAPKFGWEGMTPSADSLLTGGPTSWLALSQGTNATKDDPIKFTPISTFASKSAAGKGIVPVPFSWPAGDNNALGFTIDCARADANKARSVNFVMQGSAVSYFVEAGKAMPTPTPKIPPKAAPIQAKRTPTPTRRPKTQDEAEAGAYQFWTAVPADKDIPKGFGPNAMKLSSPAAATSTDSGIIAVQLPAVHTLKDITELTYTWRYDGPPTQADPPAPKERPILMVQFHAMVDCTKNPGDMKDDERYFVYSNAMAGSIGKFVNTDFIASAKVRKYGTEPNDKDMKFAEFALKYPKSCAQVWGFDASFLLPAIYLHSITPAGATDAATATVAGISFNNMLLPISLEDATGKVVGALEADMVYTTAQWGFTVRASCVTEWVTITVQQRCDSGLMCNTFDQKAVLDALSKALPPSAEPLDVQFSCGPCQPAAATTRVPVPVKTVVPPKTKVPPKTPVPPKTKVPMHTPTPVKDEATAKRARRVARPLAEVESSVVQIRVKDKNAARLVATAIRAGVGNAFLPEWSQFSFADEKGEKVVVDVGPAKDFTKAPWVTHGFVFSTCRDRDVCPCLNATCSCDGCPIGTESRIAIGFEECGYPKMKTQAEANACIKAKAEGCLIATVDAPDRRAARDGLWTYRPASVEIDEMQFNQQEVKTKLIDCSEWNESGSSGLWWIFLVVGVVVVVAAAVGGFLYMRNRTEEDDVRFTQPLATARGYESITPGLAG